MIIVMDSLRDTISKNFNRLVDERPELTVPMIAAAAKVTRGMVYKWKNNENIPDPDKIELLATLFKVEPIDFYKSESVTVPLYGNVYLRKYLVIPDHIVEDLSQFDANDKVWKMIETAIKVREEAKKKEVEKRA